MTISSPNKNWEKPAVHKNHGLMRHEKEENMGSGT
jgi:hypothetical protein